MNLRETYEKSKNITIRNGGLALILDKIIEEIEELKTPMMSISLNQGDVCEILNGSWALEEKTGYKNEEMKNRLENMLELFNKMKKQQEEKND